MLLLLLLPVFPLASSITTAAGASLVLEEEVVESGERAMAEETGGEVVAVNPKNWLTGATCGILHLQARQDKTVSITLDITWKCRVWRSKEKKESRIKFKYKVFLDRLDLRKISYLSYPRQQLHAEARQLNPDEPPDLCLPLLVLYRADHELVEHWPHLDPD